MGRGRHYSEDFRSDYPGRSTVDWMRPSNTPYQAVERSPFDSSDIDPTAFRKNAFTFDTCGRPQPRDYRHYDVNGGTYDERDSGYTQRGRDNFGGSDRYGGDGGGGDKLSRGAAKMRGGGGLDSYGSSSGFESDYCVPVSRRDPGDRRFESSSSRYESPSSRSHSHFDDFLHSSSSGHRHRDRSPPSRYFGPDDIGRSSSSHSRRPSMSYGGGYDSSGGYQTRIVTPGGGTGGFASSSRRGSRSRRDHGRFEID